MRYGHEQPEAPTHLGSHQLPLAPEWMRGSDEDPPTSAAAAGMPAPRSPYIRDERSAALPVARVVTERSVARPQMVAPHRASKRAAATPSAPVPAAPVLPVIPPTSKAHGNARRTEANDRSRSAAAPLPAPPPAHGKLPLPRVKTSSTSSQVVSGSTSSSRSLPRESERRSIPSLPSKSSASSSGPLSSAKRPESSSGPLSSARRPESSSGPLSSAKRPEPVSQAAQPPRMTPTPEQIAQAQAMMAAQAAAAGDPAAALAMMGALDPMNMPVPPELGAPIYGWVRRLALQADLAGADRVLRDALLDLTSSLAATIVYPGQDGLWSLGPDDEIPKDNAPVIAVAQARRAIVSSHQALVPILTSTETVGVIILTRNPRNPAYHPMEQVAMVALAREAAAILHHLAVAHLQKQSEINADKGSLYRPEALEAHRSRGTEGAVIALTPGWIKTTYWLLTVTLLIGITLAIFIRVPTYSTGSGVVWFEGANVVATTPGNIDFVYVQPGQPVKKGDIIIRQRAEQEQAELLAAQTEIASLQQWYLFDPNDPTVKTQLATLSTRYDKAKAALEQKVIRARKDGIISVMHAKPGMIAQPSDILATIVDANQHPEFMAVLPGSDRPRLKPGQSIRLDLDGFKKAREEAIITEISSDVVGSAEVAKYIGSKLADAMKLPQGASWVIVRARMVNTGFEADRQQYHFHHGMPSSRAEVKVQNKPFLSTILPALEKYLPE